MRTLRGVAATAAIAIAAVLVPLDAADAAPGSRWKVGQCFAEADVANDLVELGSAIACAKVHAVQVTGGGALPSSVTKHTYAQLRDQKNATVRASLQAFADQTCSGTRTAPGLWPKQGATLSKALTGLPATTAGGILPGSPDGSFYGWVLPDAASYAAGDKSMICVVYRPKPGTVEQVPYSGDFRLLSTSQTLPAMRGCFGFDSGSNFIEISCDKPHRDELLAFIVAKLPAKVDDMTDAQWAPIDKQCDAVLDALVGANRSDLTAITNPPPDASVNTLIYVPCYASHPANAAGDKPNLPGGTVVGLGRKPLKAA